MKRILKKVIYKTEINVYFVLTILFLLAMSEKSNAQDWANFARYENENSSLNKISSAKRVVLMGDSITEFWLIKQPDFFANKNYIVRGISGQTSSQMLIRFRPDVIQLKPEVVVILAGVNDIAGNNGTISNEKIVGNIISMIELAKANNIKVILCSVLPASNFNWRPNPNAAELILNLNQLLFDYAQKQKLSYVDFHTAMKNKNNGLPLEYSEDGVHPNLKGYQIMSDLLEKEILNVLKK